MAPSRSPSPSLGWGFFSSPATPSVLSPSRSSSWRAQNAWSRQAGSSLMSPKFSRARDVGHPYARHNMQVLAIRWCQEHCCPWRVRARSPHPSEVWRSMQSWHGSWRRASHGSSRSTVDCAMALNIREEGKEAWSPMTGRRHRQKPPHRAWRPRSCPSV